MSVTVFTILWKASKFLLFYVKYIQPLTELAYTKHNKYLYVERYGILFLIMDRANYVDDCSFLVSNNFMLIRKLKTFTSTKI